MKKIICFICCGIAINATAQNVGIGTNIPQQKLDVAGTVTIRDSLAIGITSPNAPVQLSNTMGNRKIVLFDDQNNDHQFYGLGMNTNQLRYQVAGTSNSHVFYAGGSSTNSTELMRILGNGKVGMGTATPGAVGVPTTRLEIADETGANSDFQMRTAGGAPLINMITSTGSLSNPANIPSGTATGIIQSGYFSNTAFTSSTGIFFRKGLSPAGQRSGYLQFYTSDTDNFGIRHNLLFNEYGRLGIDVTDPHASLHLKNSNGKRIILYEDFDNDNQYYGFGITPSTLRYQVSNIINSHVFYAGNGSSASVELFRINGNGNVGINQPTPLQKLDVNGNMAMNDSVILLRNGIDFNHYLRYDPVVNGPKLNGYSGGSLSTVSGNVLFWNSTGKVGIGEMAPVSTLANTSQNIVGSTGQGVSTNSLTWAAVQDGYVHAIFNGKTIGGCNGLAVKIAGTTSNNYLLDLSTGTTVNSPGVAVVTVRGDGKTGFGTKTPSEKVTIAGALKIADGGYTGLTNNDTTPIPAGGAGTITFSNNHFFGWNGTQWKQLDN